MADNHRLLQSQRVALPRDIVREPGDRIILPRRVAGPVASKIDRHDAALAREMRDLRREDPVVAGPAVYENERGLARGGAAGFEVRQTHAVAGHQDRLQFLVVNHGGGSSFAR